MNTMETECTARAIDLQTPIVVKKAVHIRVQCISPLVPLAPQIHDGTFCSQVSPITNLELQKALDKCRMKMVDQDELANAIFGILQAHPSYKATNYTLKPRSTLKVIKNCLRSPPKQRFYLTFHSSVEVR